MSLQCDNLSGELQDQWSSSFLGIEATVLLRIFYYNALGAFFESLVQRTGGCTNLLQGSSFYIGKASNLPNHYAIIRAKIYKTVKMMVVRRKFVF